MMRSSLVHIGALIGHQENIRLLVEKRRLEIRVLGLLRARLTPAMQPHCLELGLQEGVLTLFFDSPAWATRARFLSSEILDWIGDQSERERRQADLGGSEIEAIRGITEIQIRIRPDGSETLKTPTPRGGIGLSAAAAEHLLAAADSMRYPELADTFRRLAARHVEHARSDEG